MILLIGGTSETPEIANLLAENGFSVLISNLTGSQVRWDLKSGIRMRHGRLDGNAICELITKEDVTEIVDAAHPYAQEIHSNAIEAASRMEVPYYRYERPGIEYTGFDVEFADNHQIAATSAFGIGKNILLTSGTRNLKPYVKIARETDSNLYVRVLPCKESMDACRKYQIDNDHIIAERGPFTAEQNIEIIKKYSIDVLATKDSGIAGGVLEKLKAARICKIKVVVIRRPMIIKKTEKTFEVISELINEVRCISRI